MFAWLVLCAVLLILYSLFSALWFIVRDPGFSHRTARAFTMRIILSVGIFAILWVMVFTGRLEPGAVFNDISTSFNGQAQVEHNSHHDHAVSKTEDLDLDVLESKIEKKVTDATDKLEKKVHESANASTKVQQDVAKGVKSSLKGKVKQVSAKGVKTSVSSGNGKVNEAAASKKGKLKAEETLW